MRPKRSDLTSEYVHVTQRGLGRRLIFEDDIDRKRYLETLQSKLKGSDITVYAWALMDNHVHLLLKASPSALSRFMQRLGVSYAQYFNGRHGHVGKVFQNRYRAEAIEKDAHLLAAIRYIHRNPDEAGLASTEQYPWSSYQEISGTTKSFEAKGICNVKAVVSLFGSVKEFKRFHENQHEHDSFIRIDEYRARISDDDAKKIAIRQFGKDFSDHIAAMPKAKRNEALALLKDLGLSIRQIERLTGIGRGIIAKA